MTKEELLQIISSNITDNNSGDITAEKLRSTLNSMVEYTPEMENVSLDGYLYISIATPSTTPITLTGDEKVFYIATEEGDYSNYGIGNITELSIIKSDGGKWIVDGLGVPFNINNSLGFTIQSTKKFANNNPQYYFTGINIPAKTPFYVRVSSEDAVWSRLFIYGNTGGIYGQWSVEIFKKDEWVKCSVDKDITGIAVFPHTITTFGNITLEVRYDGSLKLQDDELSESINQLSDRINGGYKELQMVEGFYVNTGINIGTVCPKEIVTDPNWQYAIISDILPYSRYIVNGAGGAGPRLWAFLDKDNKVLDLSPANSSSNDSTLILTPPEGATQLIINSNNNEPCYLVISGIISEIEEIKEHFDAEIESPSLLYAEVDAEGRALRTISKDFETHYQPQKFNESIELSKKAAESLVSSLHSWGIPEVMSFELGMPTQVLSTDDNDPLKFDDGHIGYAQVVKVSRDMYYLYYVGYGTNGYAPWNSSSQSKQGMSVLFAHSTDGVNWTRGFPDGVEPPFGQTYPYSVKFVDSLSRNPFKPAFNIFLVPDSEYPFRCLTSEGQSEMYKSADGFTFIECNFVEYDQVRDNQPGVIVRGNICKVYHRGWTGGYFPENPEAGFGNRNIVVFYTDVEGNMLCQETPVIDGHYYNNAASAIDDRRELLIPTYYFSNTEPIHFDAYIVDGTRINQVDIDSDTLLQNGTLKFGLFCCGIIANGGKTYLYYVATSVTHHQIPTNTPRTSAIYRVEIKFKSNKLKY